MVHDTKPTHYMPGSPQAGCMSTMILPPRPCISHANVRNYYGPYAHCSLAINSGKFSDRSPPTDLCPLIQCIVTDTAAKPPPQFVHEYGAGGATTDCPYGL